MNRLRTNSARVEGKSIGTFFTCHLVPMRRRFQSKLMVRAARVTMDDAELVEIGADSTREMRTSSEALISWMQSIGAMNPRQ